jgi:hypothetical protein
MTKEVLLAIGWFDEEASKWSIQATKIEETKRIRQ